MVDRSKVACFSGHRNLPQDCTELQANLEKAIIELIERGVVFFGNGGAVGFDARSHVDNSAYLICYLRQHSGGTFYTVNYAEKRSLEILRL